MANKISLRTVKERQEAGLTQSHWDGLKTVPEKTVGQSHRTVGRSLELIVEFVADNPCVTRGQIATHLKRKNTPHLRSLIEHLVDVGLLEKSTEAHSGVAGFQYVYRLAE